MLKEISMITITVWQFQLETNVEIVGTQRKYKNRNWGGWEDILIISYVVDSWLSDMDRILLINCTKS